MPDVLTMNYVIHTETNLHNGGSGLKTGPAQWPNYRPGQAYKPARSGGRVQ